MSVIVRAASHIRPDMLRVKETEGHDLDGNQSRDELFALRVSGCEISWNPIVPFSFIFFMPISGAMANSPYSYFSLFPI